MKAILLDTNIVLDIALERQGFYDRAKELVEILYLNEIESFITASSVTDIYYILKKKKGHIPTISFLKNFFVFIDIAGVNKEVIFEAMKSEIKDFEDAVQIETAKQNDIETVITRNQKDFENPGMKIYSPDEFINELKKQ